MPVLPRRRHEIGQPVQEVTRREFDDAAGARPPVTGWHEDAVGRAHMQVHVVIEPRSEAVQKGHGAESRAIRNDSMNALSVGLPGLLKSSFTPLK
jgi:hypothetical protein